MVVLAAILGAHALAGAVRLKLFTEDLGAYRAVLVGGRSLTLLGVQGGIARFAEVTDRAGAEALRGMEIVVPRSALPPLDEGEYYHVDLLGLPVVDEAETPLGHVVTVENHGAGDVIEIECADGRRFMVPMRPEAVPAWDATRLVVARAFVRED